MLSAGLAAFSPICSGSTVHDGRAMSLGIMNKLSVDIEKWPAKIECRRVVPRWEMSLLSSNGLPHVEQKPMYPLPGVESWLVEFDITARETPFPPE